MAIRRQLLTLIAASLWLPAVAQQPPRSPLVQSLEVQSFTPVQVARIAGKDYAAYELHLTNLRAVDVVLSRVVVRGNDSQPLLDLRGAELVRRLGYVSRVRPKLERSIERGARAVLYFWFALPQQSADAQLQHQIEIEVMVGDQRRMQTMVDAGIKLESRPQLVLNPPLRGGPWAAQYDPQLVGGHRTVFHTLNGRTRIPARFAIDWVRLQADATHAQGKGDRIVQWYEQRECPTCLDASRSRVPIRPSATSIGIFHGSQFLMHKAACVAASSPQPMLSCNSMHVAEGTPEESVLARSHETRRNDP